MKKISWEVGRTIDGIKLMRHQFLYPDTGNIMAETHKEFPKSLKKRAKQEWREAIKKAKNE